MPSLDLLPSCGPDGNDEEVLPRISPKGAVAMGIMESCLLSGFPKAAFLPLQVGPT